MRPPRPIADLYCLVHDLATCPRVVLLNRRHNRWTGPVWIAAASAPALFGYRPPMAPALIVFGAGALSWVLDLAGLVAHVAWQRGLIWADAACEWCDPDDGDDDDPDDDIQPDGPSGHALAVEVEEWLRDTTTGTGVRP